MKGSDDGAAGTAQAMASRGRRMGQLGGKVAGAHGAAVGTAVGAGSAALSNPKMRLRLALLLFGPPILIAIVLALIVSTAVTSVSDQTGQVGQNAASAAVKDGLNVDEVSVYQQAADSSGVSWPLLAAADRSAGHWSAAGNPPFGLTSPAAALFNASAGRYGVDPLTAAQASDRVHAGYAWGRLFAAMLQASAPDLDPHRPDAGVSGMRDPADPSRSMLGISADDSDAVAQHQSAQKAFETVLGQMPGVTSGQAAPIYDAAYRWSLGQSQPTSTVCPPAAAAQAGSAAAPTVSAAGSTGSAMTPTAGQPANIPIQQVQGFNADQLTNAATIIAVGKQLQLPAKAWEIALMTSLVESSLLNLHSGDADSQGLFQQRPSAGWGTPAQITNPVLAARAFYGLADHTHNRGLVDVSGWRRMRPGNAAQAVQVSAFPDRYAHQQGNADRLITKLAGSAAAAAALSTTPVDGPGAAAAVAVVGAASVSCTPVTAADAAGPVGAPAKGMAAAAIVAAKSQLGVDYAWGGGGYKGPGRGVAQGSSYVGFDCSSLMQYAWYQASGGKITLPRITDAQLASSTVSTVQKADMQPGDLMFFRIPGEAGWGHVGMFIGGGKMIEAPHTGAQVRISDISHGYYANITTAVRRVKT